MRSCSQDGLRVSVDFFDDIFIPAGNIQQPNKFTMDTMGKPKWIWYYGDEDDGEVDEMVIEPGAKIRFRVKVSFNFLSFYKTFFDEFSANRKLRDQLYGVKTGENVHQ